MKTLCVILMCVVFLGCRPEPEPEPYIVFDRESFDRERAAWEEQGIVNYTVAEEFDSNPPTPKVRIFVEGNAITRAEDLLLGELINPSSFTHSFPLRTISGVYAMIAETYENMKETIHDEWRGRNIKYVRINVTYNKEFHYPELVSLSIFYKILMDGGGGWSLNLSEFEPLAGGK